MAQAYADQVAARANTLPTNDDPGALGGVRRAVLAGERDWVLSRIQQAPDLTLAALRGELAERGTKVSLWAVWKLLQTERITFKKKSAAG